jgi:hypothetical protein
MNRRNLLWLIVCLLGACTSQRSLAEEFRVETDVFIGNNKETIAQNLTLFSSGLVYDFPLIGPEEITVFDPVRGRFVLLDVQRKVKATLTTQDLLQLSAAMKSHASELEGAYAFAADPKFEKRADEHSGWLALTSPLLTYRAKCVPPKHPSAAARYREFADWYARLNITRPGSLPPFARLELNRAIADQGQVPEEVELTIESERRLIGKKLVIRSQHIFNWILSNTDRHRIDTAGNYMAEFQAVSLQAYRDSQQVAGR